MGHVAVRVVRAKGLLAADRAKKGMSGTSDPYVVVHSTNGARAKTSVKQATINPEWDETLEINVYDAAVPLLTLILALILTPTLTPTPTPTLTLSLSLTLTLTLTRCRCCSSCGTTIWWG